METRNPGGKKVNPYDEIPSDNENEVKNKVEDKVEGIEWIIFDFDQTITKFFLDKEIGKLRDVMPAGGYTPEPVYAGEIKDWDKTAKSKNEVELMWKYLKGESIQVGDVRIQNKERENKLVAAGDPETWKKIFTTLVHLQNNNQNNPCYKVAFASNNAYLPIVKRFLTEIIGLDKEVIDSIRFEVWRQPHEKTVRKNVHLDRILGSDKEKNNSYAAGTKILQVVDAKKKIYAPLAYETIDRPQNYKKMIFVEDNRDNLEAAGRVLLKSGNDFTPLNDFYRDNTIPVWYEADYNKNNANEVFTSLQKKLGIDFEKEYKNVTSEEAKQAREVAKILNVVDNSEKARLKEEQQKRDNAQARRADVYPNVTNPHQRRAGMTFTQPPVPQEAILKAKEDIKASKQEVDSGAALVAARDRAIVQHQTKAREERSKAQQKTAIQHTQKGGALPKVMPAKPATELNSYEARIVKQALNSTRGAKWLNPELTNKFYFKSNLDSNMHINLVDINDRGEARVSKEEREGAKGVSEKIKNYVPYTGKGSDGVFVPGIKEAVAALVENVKTFPEKYKNSPSILKLHTGKIGTLVENITNIDKVPGQHPVEKLDKMLSVLEEYLETNYKKWKAENSSPKKFNFFNKNALKELSMSDYIQHLNKNVNKGITLKMVITTLTNIYDKFPGVIINPYQKALEDLKIPGALQEKGMRQKI